MAKRIAPACLLDRLPQVRGRYKQDAALDGITWFRVGGPAEIMFRPADLQDLVDFLAAKPADIAVTVLGVGSNLLVRDGGIAGVVLRLGRGFADIEQAGDQIISGAAALDGNVAQAARRAGLTGLEFLSGVPGTIGGALRMNAGAYGSEVKDVLLWAEALTPAGELKHLTAAEIGFDYRRCALPTDWIFVRAAFQGQAGARATIDQRMAEIKTARDSSQPIRSRTGGSTFKNPPGHKAWQLIDAAGCRGLRRGAAQVSDQHCNFLINLGNASAADLEALGEEVRRLVLAQSGIELQWEIKRVGQTLQGSGGQP